MMTILAAAGAGGVVAPPAAASNVELVSYAALAVLASLGAAIAAGGEMGLYSVNRVRLSLRARAARLGDARDPQAQILAKEFENPARLVGTLLVCYNLLSYLAAVGITSFLRGLGLGDLDVVIVNLILVSPMLFVFVDAVPMEVFRLESDRLTYKLARPLRIARFVLTWTLVLPLVQAAARALGALMRGADESSITTARERITSLLKEGARHGIMSEAQVGLLDRALALREATVGDQMVAWPKAIRIDQRWSRAKVLDAVAAHPFTRFPCVSGRGGVLGVIETLDICLPPDKPEGESWSPPLKPIARLPQDMSVREGLLRLAHEGAAMAIVVAPGKDVPLGIVTTKDLVEPLTGELKVF